VSIKRAPLPTDEEGECSRWRIIIYDKESHKQRWFTFNGTKEEALAHERKLKNCALDSFLCVDIREVLQDNVLHDEQTIKNSAIKMFPIDPNKGIVYFLLRKGVIVYVGKTTTSYSRIGEHRSDKDFDSFSMLEVSREYLDQTEQKYIKKFMPEYNIAHNPSSKKSWYGGYSQGRLIR